MDVDETKLTVRPCLPAHPDAHSAHHGTRVSPYACTTRSATLALADVEVRPAIRLQCLHQTRRPARVRSRVRPAQGGQGQSSIVHESSIPSRLAPMLTCTTRSLVPAQIAITQSISGTGALRIGTAFFARHYPGAKVLYIPDPTWGNHIPIAGDAGLEVKKYTYFDKKTVGLDWEGMKADIKASRLPCLSFAV